MKKSDRFTTGLVHVQYPLRGRLQILKILLRRYSTNGVRGNEIYNDINDFEQPVVNYSQDC